MITCTFYSDSKTLSEIQWSDEKISHNIVKTIKEKMKQYAVNTGYSVSSAICNNDKLKFVIVDVYLSTINMHFISYVRH